MKVLIVEDKVKMAGLLRRALRGEGIAADVAVRGEDALWMAAAGRYDAIVLDVMLPGIDGIETCRRLRADGVWTSVLMLTARGRLSDRVAGLDSGADDYLPKPFELAELMARLRALARREPVACPAVLEVGELRLDPASRQVWRAGDEVELPAKCFSLLETFKRQPGVVLSGYERADAASTDEGVGLGLAIVRTIAEAHGGQAHAANRVNGGADVWITLPAAAASARPARGASPAANEDVSLLGVI